MGWKKILRIFAFVTWVASSVAAGSIDGVSQKEFMFPEGIDPTGKPQVNITAFGDSVLSGVDVDNSFSYIAGGSFIERFGRIVSKINHGAVTFVHNRSVAGSHAATIASDMYANQGYLRPANYFVLDGGGNDFLDIAKRKVDQICSQSAFDAAVQTTSTNWRYTTSLAQFDLNPGAKSIYLTLHFGQFQRTRERRCADGVTSPFTLALVAIAQMNYLIGQLALANHAQVMDDFGLFNCAPAVRAQCDPRLYPSEVAYINQLLAYDQRGLLRDASLWQGDDFGPTMSLLQSDGLHPNTLGHELLTERLFDLFEVSR